MLCLWCIQSFAPTKLQLTLEQDLDQAEVVKPTPDGQLKLNLPQRHVVMSNHQVYLDWMFIWGKRAKEGTCVSASHAR